VEVSPGPERGRVRVALRPRAGLALATEAGIDARLGPACGLRAEHLGAGEGARPPVRLGLGALAYFGRDAVVGYFRATPTRIPGWGGSVDAALELAASGAELTRLSGPAQWGQQAAVSLSGPSRKHSVRLEAASRELFPREGSSEAVLAAPLRSTKTSITYQLLHDARKDDDGGLGELRRGTLELAGLLGDVALAKADCLWTCSRRILGGTWGVSAAAGVAVPLASAGTVNLEDRFFLGGAQSGPGERIPGFARRGIGPADARKAADSSAAPAGEPGRAYRFGREWQTQTGPATPAAAEAPAGPALDHVGGEARASVEATLQWPLQVPLAGGFQLHCLLFGAAGSLVGRVGPRLLHDLAGEVRAAAGAGVGVPLPGGGFLGLTCAQPLLAAPGDKQERLQLWLSLGSWL